MTRRLSPLWWPVLAYASPVLAPLAGLRYRRFAADRDTAGRINDARIADAPKLELPAIKWLELTPLVEAKAEAGFATDAAVSYRVKTDRGAILFDVGYGPTTPTLAANAMALGVTMADVEALVISHLHLDHAGGMKAARGRSVAVPAELGPPIDLPCLLPDQAEAPGFLAQVVERPQAVAAGIATTGPLARSLFFLGWCEEQALVARIKGKGLVVITGCGHPTVKTILRMVRAMSDEPIYAVCGGLHFPITASRHSKAGIELQSFVGTGKPPWSPITDDDLSEAIRLLNDAGPQRVLCSPHDTCDHSLARLRDSLCADVDVLHAGATYLL